MKFKLLFLFFFITSCSHAQQWEWVIQPANLGEGSLRLAADNNGNAYLSSSEATFDNIICHLTKFDSAGNLLWDKNFNDNFHIKALATDDNGFLYLSGDFNDTVIVNGDTLISRGMTDAFLLKFNESGQTLWLKTLGSQENDFSNDVHVDYSGNILITGTLNMDAIVENINYPQKGLFVCKYNSQGNLLKMIRSTEGGRGLMSRTDSLNNIYFLGSTPYDTLFLDTVVAYPPDNYAYSFLIKFDSAGNFNWFSNVGNAKSLSSDKSGNSYCIIRNYINDQIKQFNSSGGLNWSVNIAGDYSTAVSSCIENEDFFITGSAFDNNDSVSSFFWKYDKYGNLIDEIITEPYKNVQGILLAINKKKNIFLLGDFDLSDTIDFGNIIIIRSPGQKYFFSKINGRKASASFDFIQPYEVQTLYLTSRCFADSFVKWEFPGGNPPVSYDSKPGVKYSLHGMHTVRLIAANDNSTDTTEKLVYIRPEPTDILFTRKMDQLKWPFTKVAVANTSDGGCIVERNGLFKFNNRGNLEWVSEINPGYTNFIIEVNDGFILLSNPFVTLGPTIHKTDPQGNLLWSKNYFYTELNTPVMALCASEEGGFMFGGKGIVRCDSSGEIIWQKSYPMYIMNIFRLSDNRYIIEGSNGPEIIACTDGEGNILWIKSYEGTESVSRHEMIVNHQGDIFLLGSGGFNVPQHFILRIDSAGTLKWAKNYEVAGVDILGIANINCEELMLTGTTFTNNTRGYFLLLLDSAGNQKWIRSTLADEFAGGSGIVSSGSGYALTFGFREDKDFVSRVGADVPLCLDDSMEIIVSDRNINISSETAYTDSLHFFVVPRNINPGFLRMPLIPEMTCSDSQTSNGYKLISSENKRSLIFPNPSSGKFTIQSSEKIYSIKINNLLGENVRQCGLRHPAFSISVDLLTQPKGIYFVEIVSDENSAVKKIVIN